MKNINPRQSYREAKLKVDSQVISLLSKATYESFPKVLRELISNAYDADATLVEITVNTSEKEITVYDNGNGMGQQQFEYFLTIAAQVRRKRGSPKYERERIGQFGVGFLAAFPFCREMEVETTAIGSPTIINASIPASKYFSRENIVEDYYVQGIEEITIPVIEVINEHKINEHYTKIRLKGFTTLASQFFSHATESKRKTISNFSPLERLKWDLRDNVVLDYPKDNPIASILKQPPVGMDVYLNKEKLTRIIPSGEVCAQGEFQVEEIKGRYVITSPWEPVVPVEMRGLKIHVNNVGIGPRESFGLMVHGGALPRISWLTGDVYIDEGGRNYLSINRDGFTNAPVIEALFDKLRGELRQAENKITSVDTRLKQIESKLGLDIKGGGPRPSLQVGDSKEFVEENLNELSKTGFSIERVTNSKNQINKPSVTNKSPSNKSEEYRSSPIEIDRLSKIIKVYDNHPGFEDTISSSSGKYMVEFSEWNYRDNDYPACMMTGENCIRVNSSYPPFRNRKYGRIILHLAVTLARFAENGEIEKSLMKKVLLDWVKEMNYIND